MRTRIRHTPAFLCLLFLSLMLGCASNPDPYDGTIALGIETIGILRPNVPGSIQVESNDQVFRGNTILGLALAIPEKAVRDAILADREERLNAALEDRGFSAEDILMESLMMELEARGYRVEAIPTPRDHAGDPYEYPDISRVDAFLHTAVEEISYARDQGCRYWCYSLPYNNLERAYRPRVTARVRLVRAVDSSTLMMRTVKYNPVNGGLIARQEQPIEIMRNPDYEFGEFDEIDDSLLAGETTVEEGLEDAIVQVADAIADSLQ